MKDKDYINYTAEDFSLDASFRAYYLSADEAHIRFWKHWIEDHPEKREEIKEAIALLDVLFTRLPDDEFEEQLRKFSDITGSVVLPEEKERPLRRVSAWIRIAAMISFLIFAGWAGYQMSQRFSTTPSPETQAIRQISRSTMNGQKATITLQDGTKIHLNAASQLSFPEYFRDSLREVSLKGEAYFEVASDEQKPFIVKTGDLYTQVLGTSFNINAYPETKGVKVVLVEGKVQVVQRDTKESLILQPSEMALFHKDNLRLEKAVVNTREFTVWREGIILFERASFEEIQQVLERWYDVQFEYQQKPAMQGFSGEFKDQSLKAVMDGISFSVGFSYTIEGKKVIINS